MSAAQPTDAREAILSRVRAALVDVPAGPPEQETPVPWQYGAATGMADVLARFAETVDDYRATVVRCPPEQVPDRITEALRAAGVASVVVPDGVPEHWRRAASEASARVLHDEPPLTKARLDECDAVLTAAAVGIAETGTIVLDHRADQGRRALTLIPDVHVCVVTADQVVSDVPEAVARLAGSVREGRPLTWISGPSATSDIELDRVEGVHGPRTLVMILAG
ncbi:LutC/YkgG family protein [Agilicoccus flavus]|uniref:LutC/YkgG family protein n=1 Tax=Agilicoccus flavus TaxID=2775968 RepID=UPI001CF68721|nr:lactate utilization protein C [Agilicoccus flavus]